MRHILLVLILVFSAGCSFQSKGDRSVILIAVDGLNFDDISCETQSIASEGFGIQKLCNESVRFTHAYTPSTLTQPALTSILTGLFPHDHGVRDNGKNYLKGKHYTASEAALAQGYRTALFSGGMPILRNSGLQQGFEVFNDNIQPKKFAAYRNAQDTFNSFKYWLGSSVGSGNFFVTFFLNDLNFPEEVTKTNSGEIRTKTRTSQLLEISESIGNLLKVLKDKGIYNSTTIILVGTNGHLSTLKAKELPPYSLRSENTRVTLLVKPPQKKRDLSLKWKIDSYISTADLGTTFFDLLGATNHNFEGQNTYIAPTYTLLPAITDNKFNAQKGRLIPIESAWPKWRARSNIRFALRKQNYLIEYDKTIKVYNSHVDQKDLHALSNTTPFVTELKNETESFFRKKGIDPWRSIKNKYYEKYYYGYLRYKPKPDPASFHNLLQYLSTYRNDKEVSSWLAQYYLSHGNWPQLKRLAVKVQQGDWLYVANQNLKQKRPGPTSKCLKSLGKLKTKESLNRKDCKDHDFVLLYTYLKNDKRFSAHRFINAFRSSLIAKNLAEQNYANYLVWDLNNLKYIKPSYAELTLNLPWLNQNKKFFKKELRPWFDSELSQLN